MPRASKSKQPSPVAAAAAPAPTAAAASSAASLRQLAHELNSLLDGSMRCVGLARQKLQDQPNAAGTTVDDGLGKAHAAMRHMAALLEKAMRQAAAPEPVAAILLFDESQTIGGLCADLSGLLSPHASSSRAKLTFAIAPECNELPAGPLGPVVMNGLRNALEACETLASSAAGCESELVASFSIRDGLLHMVIAGPAATKPTGHRIGMGLSEQLVRELGGELALTTADHRTTLRMCVPAKSLNRHA